MANNAPRSNLAKISKPNFGRRRAKGLPFRPEQVWVDRSVSGHPQAIRILNALSDVPVDVVDDVRALKRPRELSDAKRQLVLTRHQGQAFKPCQGMGPGHLCCGYRVLDLVSGCPMDCSYCILQSYLANNPVTTVHVNLEEILAEVAQFLADHPQRFFRIGTGELADSLALDPILDYASVLVPFFARTRNALLELKTKSNFVDGLLPLKHGNRTVVAWSVNTPEIIASDERETASLDERLEAARRVADAGYGVAFHFDPIVIVRDAEREIESYLDVARRITDAIEERHIAWVSLGLLRYPPELKDVAVKRFPETKIFSGEFVPADGKMRYLRFLREKAYRPLWDCLRERIPERKLYLCMETEAVWKKIDPATTSSACIEKRLCNTEAIAFDYRM